MGDCAAQGLVEQLLPYLRRSHPDLLMPRIMGSQWFVDLMDLNFFGQLSRTHFYTHLPNPRYVSGECKIALAFPSNEKNFDRFLVRHYSVDAKTWLHFGPENDHQRYRRSIPTFSTHTISM